MRGIIFILAIFFVISCSNSDLPENSIHPTIVQTDSSQITSDKFFIDSVFSPSDQFLLLVKQIDTAGYIWDTTRIKNVSHYFRTDSFVTKDSYVFYKMQIKDSWIIEYYNLNKGKKNIDSLLKEGLIQYEYFENAISVFGYYYRQEDKADLMVDGYIEEWLFPTSQEAEKALKDVYRVKEMVYFNTPAFCCQIDKRMYIFHVRASGFGIPMRQFFKKFVKENKAVVPQSVNNA